MSDDAFEIGDETWHRMWRGDNGGRYVWATSCGRLLAGRSGFVERPTPDGGTKLEPVYDAALDGQALGLKCNALVDAMSGAMAARSEAARKRIAS